MFQIRIQACDRGKPAKCNTTVALLNVVTNFQAPVFTDQSYYKLINETYIQGVTVVDTTANDLDSVVSYGL